MSSAYAYNNTTKVHISCGNLRYWDDERKEWRAPSEINNYINGQWKLVGRSIPLPGVKLNAGYLSGRVLYAGLGLANVALKTPSTYSAAQSAGYFADGIVALNRKIKVEFHRAPDTTSGSRHLRFVIMLFSATTGEGLAYASAAQNEYFSFVIDGKHLGSYYLAWDSGGTSNGSEFRCDGQCTVTFQ